jgi:hypothetical protein
MELSAVETTSTSSATISDATDVSAKTHFCVVVVVIGSSFGGSVVETPARPWN